MTSLKLRFVDTFELYRDQPHALATGELFVPVGTMPALGESVSVDVGIVHGPSVVVRGQVTWRRTASDARTRAGVGVAVDAAGRRRLNFLEGVARGVRVDERERRRLPVRLKVAYAVADGRRISFTRDIDEKGAFVRAADLLDVGRETTLHISPPGDDREVRVRAHVRRQEQRPFDSGMGLTFAFVDDDEREQVSALVALLENDYRAGRLPDEAVAG